MHFWKRGRHKLSNLALVKTIMKSSLSTKESTSIVTYIDDDKFLFAFSHYILILLKAFAFYLRSMPFFFINSDTQ